MRILITGDRNWASYKIVSDVIKGEFEQMGAGILYVRHGKATGADKLASTVVGHYRSSGHTNVVEEPFPAEWQHEGCEHPKGVRADGSWYCKAAGPLRNQRMLDAPGTIDRVHAFPLRDSKGTPDMMRRAVDAGLVVLNHGFPVDIPGVIMAGVGLYS